MSPEFEPTPTFAERLDFVAGFLRRRWLVILLSLLAVLPLGALYLYLTPKSYTASAVMMIETRGNSVKETMFGAAPDPAWIESQAGILMSAGVVGYVVKQLKLAENDKFLEDHTLLGFFDRLIWGKSEPKSESERVAQAVGTVAGGLSVKRVGQSYMMRVDFEGRDSDLAVKVANTMIDGYVFDQLNAKYQANRRAGDWLQERLQALREQANTAERAVLEFKAKNNIVASEGRLMNEKELTEISSALAGARSKVADIQLRLSRIERVREVYQQERLSSSVTDESVTEEMNNPIINSLRSRYLELMNRFAEWSTKYSDTHVAVVNLRKQIVGIRSSIRDELGRIEETYKSEYEIARKREDELQKALAGLVSQSAQTNQAQVSLFSLEAAAKSYRRIYDSFLQQHTETVQQQSYPISDARQLSAAFITKTSPRAIPVSLITLLAGGMLGIGIGALRELLDRGFRTREQVRSVLEVECFALIPAIEDLRSARSIASWLTRRGSNRYLQQRNPSALWWKRDAELVRAVSDGRQLPSDSSNVSVVMRSVIDAPASPLAEALRSIKLSVDLGNSPTAKNLIGVTSCLPGEGKSTVSAALATNMALEGARVLLIDCDIRNPSLSRALAPNARVGLVEVLKRNVAFSEAALRYGEMTFLPTVANSNIRNAMEVLTSPEAKAFFEALKGQYDYVVVDLSPLSAASDVRATTPFMSSYVLVIEWGSTKVDAVQYALNQAPEVHNNIIGTVLNKVDIEAMRSYDRNGAHYYYTQYGYPQPGPAEARH